MSQALEEESDPTFTHFAHRADFKRLLERFIILDVGGQSTIEEEEEEDKLVEALGAILDFYLSIPGLLDPHLDDIVPRLMTLLSTYLPWLVDGENIVNPTRLARIGRLVNWVLKVRGWKAIVPYFPSTISFLPMLITLLSPPHISSATTPSSLQHPFIAREEAWELRVVLLLWLALLLTAPFDLSALSSTPTSLTQYSVDLPAREKLFVLPTSDIAQRVILLILPLLHRQGKEGTYAALVLARLFSRSDACSGLPGFFDWAGAEIIEAEREGEANLVSSVLDFLSVLPRMIAPERLEVMRMFTDEVLLPHLRGSRTAASSGLVRKSAVKAKGRWWVARMGRGFETLEHAEMPEHLEEQLDDLMSGLGDKDTIVRYSSAKYLARLTCLLPPSLSEQVVLQTVSLLSGTEDEPVVLSSFGTVIDPGGSASGSAMGFGGHEASRGEARWHGVCLALAEMARRALLLDGDAISQAIGWVTKALRFDLRRASHSIGANVRDAAAYLLWSMSRACPPKTLAPFAQEIATSLICTACLDREVGVRRAASAAFQEGVGRIGLYPEGIDVLRSTDFYSVSVRRTAFTIAASSVARHQVYRDCLRMHLHNITLRHWDVSMRTLGAITLRSMLDLGQPQDVDDSMGREIQQIPSLDATSVHGAILALTQIAQMPSSSISRHKEILSALSTIRPASLASQLASALLQSVCGLINACLSLCTLHQDDTRSLLDRYLELASRRRETECHEAVGKIYQRLSQLQDCAKEVKKLVTDLKSVRSAQRQCAALALGQIHYTSSSAPLQKVISPLLYQLKPEAKADVETRRYAVRSLAGIASQVILHDQLLVPVQTIRDIIGSFVTALSDYSTDQRGDVGSWIRSGSLDALGQTISMAAKKGLEIVPQSLFEEVIGGIVKQAVEKLEPTRTAAALALAKLRSAEAHRIWTWEEHETLLFTPNGNEDDAFRYYDQLDWYSSAGPLLETRYRSAVLAGLILSIGGQASSISKIALFALLNYLEPLQSHFDNVFSPILEDHLTVLIDCPNENRVFVPAVVTVTKILGASEQLKLHVDGRFTDHAQETFVRILQTACRGVANTRSIDRITSAMKLNTTALSMPSYSLKNAALECVPLFLAHRFPRIRAMTSEQLSTSQDELDPELAKVLLSTSWTESGVGEKEAEIVVDMWRRGWEQRRLNAM